MTFKPGISGNPSGRPASAVSIAKKVAAETRNGDELIERLIELSRDPQCPIRERLAATFALIDRMAGKPMAPSEVSLAVSQGEKTLPDEWDSMTGPQRLAWCDATRQRALGGRS